MNFKESGNNSVLLSLPSSAERNKGFRQDVQGLRAIAVLAVMVFHASKTWLPAGFIGVDVFFVISGFIISSLIVESQTKFSWREFYWGRVKRIVPAYFFMLLTVSIFSSLIFISADFSFFKQSLTSAILFFSNQYFSDFGSYFAPGSHDLPLLHTWSLAIEMQFYLCLPILIWLTPRKRISLLICVLCIALFLFAEWQLQAQENQRHVYFSLLARIPEFLVGALIAVARIGNGWSTRFSAIVGSAGLILLAWCFIYTNEASFPGGASFIPCFAAALIISSRQGPISNLLSSRSLVWVGALSYSLYLWHWPVLTIMRYYVGQYELSSIWLFSFVAITFTLSLISYRWVESPVRRSSGIFKKTRNIWLLMGGAVLAIGSTMALNSIVEKPLPVEMTRYAPASEICHGQIVGDCVRGDRDGKISILVLGDSHAAQLNEFFDVAGKEDKFSARVITASNCVPIPGFDTERIPDYSRADCRSQISALTRYIDEANIIVVAAMWQWQTQSVEFMQAFSDFLENTTRRNIKVVVLAQVPMFDVNLLRVRRFVALGLPVTVNENKEWEADNRKIASMVKRYKNAEFFDLSRSGFFIDAPFYNGELIYQDSHHLNEVGARGYGLFSAPLLKTIFSNPLND